MADKIKTKISPEMTVKLLDLVIEKMARMIKGVKSCQKRLDADLAEMQSRS